MNAYECAIELEVDGDEPETDARQRLALLNGRTHLPRTTEDWSDEARA